MAASGRAILLAPETPYPVVGGGALRAAALVEHLARNWELDTAVFRQPGAPDPRQSRLARLAKRVLVLDLPHHARHHAARAARNTIRLWRGVPPLMDRFAGFEPALADFVAGHSYELGVVEHFWCAPYQRVLGTCTRQTVLDLHNIESALHGACAAAEPLPLAVLHRRFRRACLRLERQWLPRFSLALVTSEQDARRLHAICPQCRVEVYPNTIPGNPRPERTEEDFIAFSANMEYHPNLDAVRYFRKEIWPRLRERWKSLEWVLVGKNPEAVSRYTGGDPRIRVLGPVEDAIEVLARAKVAIVPMRSGSGTRVKILEAWAAGAPVVSTSMGADGLGAVSGKELVIADSPREFADAVDSLLRSPDTRMQLGDAGRRLYERDYTWEAGWKRLTDLGI
ncbi:MAG: glycosyltransferase [bacterium]|nr:glycosyltransferase [bacterium]